MSQLTQLPKEHLVSIPTPDGKRIYATLGVPDSPEESLGTVVFVHGFACSDIWPPLLLGSWYARKRGFHYCRINLYDWRADARTLATTDFQQHANDINTVISWLGENKLHTCFGVGHSFGGLALILSDTSRFRALSLWDISSFLSHPSSRTYLEDEASGARYFPAACELLISERFAKGAEAYPDELELISSLRTPTQICYAAGPEAMLIESSHRYFEHLQGKKELVEIPAASHSFVEEGVGEVLFKATLEWFTKHVPLCSSSTAEGSSPG